MKTFKEIICITTKKTEEVMNITSTIEKLCRHSGIKNGFVLVHTLHTTASVFINDSDERITDDIMRVLGKIVPASDKYMHDETDFKKNASGHIRGSLLGHNIVLAICDGELELGKYQTIYYADFDGKRPKEILAKIIGE